MTPAAWIAVLWASFLGAHVFFSHPPVRSRLSRALGESGFKGAYSILSMALFTPLVMTWWSHRHGGDLLWNLRTSPVAVHAAEALSVLGFFLMFGAFYPPSPSYIPAASVRKPLQARGMSTLTRHPLFMGMSLWAGSHLLMNGWGNDTLFFSGFIVTALLGTLHQDWRKSREIPSYRELMTTTGWLPFGAWVRGRGRPRLGRAGWVGGLLGGAIAVLLRVFHHSLFG